MKFSAALLFLTGAQAFVASSHSRSSSVLSATVEKTELVPPRSTADMMKEQDATAKSYESHVQKTYGYVTGRIQRRSHCSLFYRCCCCLSTKISFASTVYKENIRILSSQDKSGEKSLQWTVEI